MPPQSLVVVTMDTLLLFLLMQMFVRTPITTAGFDMLESSPSLNSNKSPSFGQNSNYVGSNLSDHDSVWQAGPQRRCRQRLVSHQDRQYRRSLRLLKGGNKDEYQNEDGTATRLPSTVPTPSPTSSTIRNKENKDEDEDGTDIDNVAEKDRTSNTDEPSSTFSQSAYPTLIPTSAPPSDKSDNDNADGDDDKSEVDATTIPSSEPTVVSGATSTPTLASTNERTNENEDRNSIDSEEDVLTSPPKPPIVSPTRTPSLSPTVSYSTSPPSDSTMVTVANTTIHTSTDYSDTDGQDDDDDRDRRAITVVCLVLAVSFIPVIATSVLIYGRWKGLRSAKKNDEHVEREITGDTTKASQSAKERGIV